MPVDTAPDAVTAARGSLAVARANYLLNGALPPNHGQI